MRGGMGLSCMVVSVFWSVVAILVFYAGGVWWRIDLGMAATAALWAIFWELHERRRN